MIPFQDLGRLHRSIAGELEAALLGAVRSSDFVGGEAVTAFEAAFASAHNARGAVACGSGTDALTLSLLAGGLGPGDEVIVPSMTFIATAEAVVHAGGQPVIADVDPRTLLLTPETVAAVRSPRTRAVIPVHLYGHVIPHAHILAWRESGLLVIEDAAQAHLARSDGKEVGTSGDAACFSFYPGKNLGAFGDGGAVTASDASFLDEVRMLRDHGRRDKYVHERIGYCSRLDAVQAAVLTVKLRYLPQWTSRRQNLAAQYLAASSTLGFELVPWHEGAVHHLLVARVAAAERDRIQIGLRDNGIITGVHYPLALSQQPALADARRPTPAAESAAASVLSLPMDPLMTVEDVDKVCDTLSRLISAA